MNRNKIRQTCADLINNKRDISTLDLGQELFFIQMVLYKMGKNALVRDIGHHVATKLSERGLLHCGEYGWYKKEDISIAGIEHKFGRWVISNLPKYLAYWKEKEEQEKLTKAERAAKQQSLVSSPPPPDIPQEFSDIG